MRRKPNKVGLTLTDYQKAFAAWKLPGWICIAAFNQALTLEETKTQFIDMNKIKMPKRQRSLGTAQLQRIIRRKVIELGRQYASRPLLYGARKWLNEAIPETKGVMPPGQIQGPPPVNMHEGIYRMNEPIYGTKPLYHDPEIPYVAPGVPEPEKE